MSLEELRAEMTLLGQPAFRASQIFAWIHKSRVSSFEEMTSLSKDLRKKLKDQYSLPNLKIARMLESAKDGTRKYLYELEDGNVIEAVFMRYHHGNSVCVSTQVGCRMGCRFCASTIGGVIRSLSASEMLEEVYRIEEDTKEVVSNVVLMGSGEPMDNYDNVVRFIRLLTDENGRGMSRRNITVSTCGLPDRIRSFADEDLGVTLALSLHAPDDETRRTLMPIANRYSLKEVLAACDYYFEKTGRRMTYEYSVVRGVNDTEEEARKLGRLLKGRNAHVNLIPVNPIAERNFERPMESTLYAFQKVLESFGLAATIRREMGADIQGACGQLRYNYLKEQEGGDQG